MVKSLEKEKEKKKDKKEKEKKKRKYQLEGLSCTNCAAKIESEVKDLAEIENVSLNFANSSITVEGAEVDHEFEAELQNISDRIEPGLKVRDLENKNETGAGSKNQDSEQSEQNNYLKWRFIPGSIIFAAAIILFKTSLLIPQGGEALYYLEWLFFVSSYLLIGGPVLKAAFRNIKRGKVFDENFLMVTATLGAFAIQEFPEAVAVMLFYMVGEMFQQKAVGHSRRSIAELMDIRPDYANLKEGDKITQVDPNQVQIGDLIMIKPGEKVPLDGQVIEGSSMLDTSALTGESVPRKIEKGEEVLGGMINKDGLLTVEVSKEYGQSTVSKILELVENASSKKAPTEQFITKFAHYYTPAVVYTALAIALLPPLFLEGALFSDWLYRALIFLVVSCPCALVVSIPLGFFGGIGKASREGVLVKGGNYLEALNNVKQIVFDKTGTLSRGEFAVTEVKTENGFTEKEVLKLAAYAENHSTHPIAKSIKEAAAEEVDNEQIESYQELSGRGIKARVSGREILAGNQKLMEQEGISSAELQTAATIVYLAVDGQAAGQILISDQMKEDSKTAVTGLRKLGISKITMLTGDREKTAAAAAAELELDSYFAELMPDQKVKKVEELLAEQSKNDKLIFVGDGINDAPVLARSDIGVAMGGLGSDAAIEAADIVLMTDEPSKLIKAVKIAKKTRKIVWQNIAFALGIKGIVLLLGAFGMATMWEAVFADVGVALLAVLNSMRIVKS